MTSLLLDTSAYAAYHLGHPEIGNAVRDADETCLTPVVLGELLDGFRRGAQRGRNESYLRKFLSASRTRMLAMDGETAERYASILEALRTAGTPIPANDVWIASSAMQHGLVLITTDAHFDRVPQIIVRRFDVT